MDSKNKDILRKIAIQRDSIKCALGDLCHYVRNGVFNGMLHDHNPRRNGSPNYDPNAKCEGGETRRGALWNMGRGKCGDCTGVEKGCHLSREEFNMFRALNNALRTMDVAPAEMPEVKPEDFVEYNPDKYSYKATPRWIARNIYKLCVGYWLFSDHNDCELEKRWERAFDDTLCISLGADGSMFKKMMDAAKSFKNEKQAMEFKQKNPSVEEFVDRIEDSIGESVKKESDVDALVMKFALLRCEYRFCHDYPGADMGVYGDVFSCIMDGCLNIVGLSCNDRPRILDFDDRDEYMNKKLEYNADKNDKIFAFMSEESGLEVKLNSHVKKEVQ